jgi:5-methylthioribose kinase
MSQQFDLSTPQGVLAYLAQTRYASARADPLSGGTTNFVFRLHLNMPYEGRTTLILKHARPYVARRPDFPLPVSRQVRIKNWPRIPAR